MARLETKKQTENKFGKDVKEEELLCSQVGIETGPATVEIGMETPQKSNYYMIHDTNPEMIPQNHPIMDPCIFVFSAVLFTITKILDQLRGV